MLEVTDHQIKRIRRADAADIARMLDRDQYWSEGVLRRILKRIETLNHEDPDDAIRAGESALQLVKLIRDASPDLHALTIAIHGSSLRYVGKLQDALQIYNKALGVEGLSKPGRGDVLARMAVTQICLGHVDRGLDTINEALDLVADTVSALTIRAFALRLSGNLAASLDDCITIFESTKRNPRSDYSLLSAITTSCNILSYETGIAIEPAIFEKLETIIEEYRQRYAGAGSGFYKVRRPRLMLSRARALLMMKTGRSRKAIVPLQRAIRGLSENYPDDALAAALDLMCAYTQAGLYDKAAMTASTALELLDRIRFSIRPLARNALRVAATKSEILPPEAIELRSMLRPENSP